MILEEGHNGLLHSPMVEADDKVCVGVVLLLVVKACAMFGMECSDPPPSLELWRKDVKSMQIDFDLVDTMVGWLLGFRFEKNEKYIDFSQMHKYVCLECILKGILGCERDLRRSSMKLRRCTRFT